MTTAAIQLRDYLAADDFVEHYVGANVFLESDYPYPNDPAVVISPPASHEPANAIRIFYIHRASDFERRLLLGAILDAIERLPLAEVIANVNHPASSGRVTVLPGICEESQCPA